MVPKSTNGVLAVCPNCSLFVMIVTLVRPSNLSGSNLKNTSEPCACAVPPKKKRKLMCSVNSKEHFVSSVDRGGLSHATEVSFTVCALAYAYFEQIKSDEALRSTFLCSKNQQRCFVNSVLFTLDSESQFNYLKQIKCSRNLIWSLLLVYFYLFCLKLLLKNRQY